MRNTSGLNCQISEHVDSEDELSSDVSILGNIFDPSNVTIKVGDTLVWVPLDTHNVAEVDNSTSVVYNGGIRSGSVGSVPMYMLKFTKEIVGSKSTFYFICEAHVAMGMRMQVNVRNTTKRATTTVAPTTTTTTSATSSTTANTNTPGPTSAQLSSAPVNSSSPGSAPSPTSNTTTPSSPPLVTNTPSSTVSSTPASTSTSAPSSSSPPVIATSSASSMVPGRAIAPGSAVSFSIPNLPAGKKVQFRIKVGVHVYVIEGEDDDGDGIVDLSIPALNETNGTPATVEISLDGFNTTLMNSTFIYVTAQLIGITSSKNVLAGSNITIAALNIANNTVISCHATINGHLYYLPVTIVSDKTLSIELNVMNETDNTGMVLYFSLDNFVSLALQITDLVYLNPSHTLQVQTFTDMNTTMQAFSMDNIGIPGIESTPLDLSIIVGNSSISDEITVLKVMSVFNNTGVKSRRAMRKNGSYGFVNRTAYVEMAIDSSSTGGNVAELWMFLSTSKFVQGVLSIVPATKKQFLSLVFNSTVSAQAQMMQVDCPFITNVNYRFEIKMVDPTVSAQQYWYASAELSNTKTKALVCSTTIQAPGFSPSDFFYQMFTLILSQSSQGGDISSRRVQATDTEEMSILVSKLGIECQKGVPCDITGITQPLEPTVTAIPANMSYIGIIIAVVLVIALMIAITFVIIIAVILYRQKKRRVDIYTSQDNVQEIKEEESGLESIN
jgi:plastocyanin